MNLGSLIAVAMGFATTGLIVSIGTLVAMRLTKTRWGEPTPRYLTANIAMSALGGLAGGYLAGRIAPGHGLPAALVLALLFFLSGAASALRGPQAGQPPWYPWVICVLVALAVVLGALLPVAT